MRFKQNPGARLGARRSRRFTPRKQVRQKELAPVAEGQNMAQAVATSEEKKHAETPVNGGFGAVWRDVAQ